MTQQAMSRGGGTGGELRREVSDGRKPGAASHTSASGIQSIRGGGKQMATPARNSCVPRHLMAASKEIEAELSLATVAPGLAPAESWTLRLWQQVFAEVAQGLSSDVSSWAAVRASASAAETSRAGGQISCAFAHARRWRAVWQQQLRQHWSALRQPHWLNMQGNARLRSLAYGTGIGKPLATNTNNARLSHPQSGKLRRAIVRNVWRECMAGAGNGQV